MSDYYQDTCSFFLPYSSRTQFTATGFRLRWLIEEEKKTHVHLRVLRRHNGNFCHCNLFHQVGNFSFRKLRPPTFFLWDLHNLARCMSSVVILFIISLDGRCNVCVWKVDIFSGLGSSFCGVKFARRVLCIFALLLVLSLLKLATYLRHAPLSLANVRNDPGKYFDARIAVLGMWRVRFPNATQVWKAVGICWAFLSTFYFYYKFYETKFRFYFNLLLLLLLNDFFFDRVWLSKRANISEGFLSRGTWLAAGFDPTCRQLLQTWALSYLSLWAGLCVSYQHCIVNVRELVVRSRVAAFSVPTEEILHTCSILPLHVYILCRLAGEMIKKTHYKRSRLPKSNMVSNRH